jgi:hypothetical protein
MYWHRLTAMMGGRCENSPGLFPFRAAASGAPLYNHPEFPDEGIGTRIEGALECLQFAR